MDSVNKFLFRKDYFLVRKITCYPKLFKWGKVRAWHLERVANDSCTMGLYCLYLSLYDSYDERHRWEHPTRMRPGGGGRGGALIACGFWKRKSFPLIMILLKGSPLWAHTSMTTRTTMVWMIKFANVLLHSSGWLVRCCSWNRLSCWSLGFVVIIIGLTFYILLSNINFIKL